MLEKFEDRAEDRRKEEEAKKAAEAMPFCLIEYDAKTGGFRWKFFGAIPTMAMVGALELLKSALIDSQKMQMAQAVNGQMKLPKIVTSNGQKMPPFRM